MITLLTGVPGAGKTLSAIKMVLKLSEDEPNRPVYYHHIDGCSITAWNELSAEDVREWNVLPDGAIIIVDECHQIFPQRTRMEAPAFIKALDEHRHSGYDFYLITQQPRKIDVEVRRLVGRHFHYDRRFASKRISRYEFQRCVDDPTDRREIRQAVRTGEMLDKSIFALYHSAEVHTHKFKLPFKVVMVLVLVGLVAPIGIWWVISTMADRFSSSDDAPDASGSLAPEVTASDRYLVDALNDFDVAVPFVIDSRLVWGDDVDIILSRGGLVFSVQTLQSLGFLYFDISACSGLVVDRDAVVSYLAACVVAPRSNRVSRPDRYEGGGNKGGDSSLGEFFGDDRR